MQANDALVIAACLSAVAAIAAAVATWRAPISAARIAESLRRAGDKTSERQRFRLNVFAQIMQGRAEIWAEDSVRALNSIDVAFSDSRPVREAWVELYQALDTAPLVKHVFEEKTRKLLQEMAKDLGLADNLRLDDFARIYFPKAMREERDVAFLRRQAALRQFAEPSQPAENVGLKPPSPWPSKPT